MPKTDRQSGDNTKSRRKRVILLIVAIVLVAFLCYWFWPRHEIRLQLGPDTSVFDGPLRSDGTVDYIAALNRRAAEGVTPETNAAVLLAEVWNIDFETPEYRREFYEGIGLPPDFAPSHPLQPQEEFDRAIDQEKRLEALRADPLSDMYGLDVAGPQGRTRRVTVGDLAFVASRRPWTAEEFPAAAAWVEANEKALEIAERASHRPDLFVYVGPHDAEQAILVMMPHLTAMRQVVVLLRCRSMLLANEGKYEDAMRDAMTVRRLARLLADPPVCLLQHLVAIKVEGVGIMSMTTIATSEALSAAQAAGLCRVNQGLPPVGDLSRAFNEYERLLKLDLEVAGVRRGFGYISGATGSAGGADSTPLWRSVDVNEMLRHVNRWFDRYEEGFAAPSDYERLMAMDRLVAQDRGHYENKPSRLSLGNVRWSRFLLPPHRRRRVLGRAVADTLLMVVLPNVANATRADVDARQRQDVLQLALALAWRHAETGEYPTSLDELVPRYIERIPIDRFTNEPLVYRLQEDGYLLYGVGENGTDDQGRADDVIACVGKRRWDVEPLPFPPPGKP